MDIDILKGIVLNQTDLNYVGEQEWIRKLDDSVKIDSQSNKFKTQTSAFS